MIISLLDLPNEIILEILEYVKDKTLLALSETCKRLNELIFETSLFMDEISLRLDLSARENKSAEILMESKREYRNIKVLKELEANIPILKKFKDNVQHLEILECKIGLNDFHYILDRCPNIVTLKIEYSYTIVQKRDPYSLPKLERLKCLTVNDSDCELFRMLSNVRSVTDLKLRFGDYDVDYFNYSNLNEFIRRQKNLESFSLDNVNVRFHTDFLSFRFKTQLKKIQISNCKGFTCMISRFLKEQTNLEEVSLIKVGSYNKINYDHLLTNNPKLHTLALDIRHYRFVVTIRTNVKNLKLSCESFSYYYHADAVGEERPVEMCDIKQLLAEFPNVEKLELIRLRHLDHSTFKLIADKMLKLTELTIIECPTPISFDNIKFASLKSLHLLKSRNLTEENFKSLLEHNKQITHLEIEYGRNLTDTTMQFIVDNLKDLETLQLENCRQLTKNVFPMIAENLNKLKLFKMSGWAKNILRDDMAALNSVLGLKFLTDVVDKEYCPALKKCKHDD